MIELAEGITPSLKSIKFPVNNNDWSELNLKKIVKVVHKEIRKKMKLFLIKNRNRKIIILDIPLLLENKINNKKDILVYVDSKKSKINKRLKNRLNFNNKLFAKFKKNSSFYN